MNRLLTALALSLALGSTAFAATPVDINHADAATIANALDGVGLSKAKAIVAYREAHGPFTSADQVGKVKGIGDRTLERNRAAIQLGAVTPKHK